MNAPEAVYADRGGGVCARRRERARAAPAGSRSLAGLGLFVASRALSIATTAINWDEFALLDRVARTARTGVPETGGRPGLAEWLLLPIVSACSDEIATARMARWLWLGLTLCFLAGLYAMLLELLRGRPQRRHDALFGVALLALVPAFLEWSLQVRTDQLALAGGVWGGMLLLASQRRAPLALAAGILFGVGYLGSQKLLYAAALAGLLAAGRAWIERDLRPAREALRATLCLAGFGLVFAAFRAAHGRRLRRAAQPSVAAHADTLSCRTRARRLRVLPALARLQPIPRDAADPACRTRCCWRRARRRGVLAWRRARRSARRAFRRCCSRSRC